MNCDLVRDKLALLLYGDVGAAEKAELEKHLAECAGCRRELRLLGDVRRLLNSQRTPDFRIDLPLLYRQAAARQVRRWRRVAILVTGVAALFAFVAFGLRLEA